ncbi:MAG TPA: ATP-binding protein [Ignavibacteriaceae bacterium]
MSIFFELPRKLDELKPLRDHLDVFCVNESEEFGTELTLASFEVVTNIIRHTPDPLEHSPIGVFLEEDPIEIKVSFEYEGELFIPPNSLEPDFSGNSDGGFGLYIIENCVDKIIYDSPKPGLAQLILIKKK